MLKTPSATRIAVVAGVFCSAIFAGCKDAANNTAPPPSGGIKPQTVGGLSVGGNTAFNEPSHPTGDVKLKVITNGISPFWDSMGKGLDEMKKTLSVDATWQAPDKADNNAQKQVFDNAIAANVTGLAVSPIQADAFASSIDAAMEKGIPVITFDSDAPKSRRLAYIGTNNFEAGKKAGEEAVKLFPNGGNVVAFVGNMSAQNAQDRFDGFVAGVKGHKIEILNTRPMEDDKDVGRARRNVADAITKFGPKINGFLGLYSYNGPAIVDEVEKAHLLGKVKIICFDGEPKTLANLASGKVDLTIVQKPYEFGRITTKLLFLINRKGYKAAMDELKPELEKAGMHMKGDVIDTGVDAITPANSAAFLKMLKDKGLEST